MQVGSILPAIIAAISTAVFMTLTGIIRDAFFKGGTKALLKQLETAVRNGNQKLDAMQKEINTLKEKDSAKQSIINRMVRDHEALEDSLEKMNDNINKNNQSLAKVDATLSGVQNLLELIFKGNLKIQGQQ